MLQNPLKIGGKSIAPLLSIEIKKTNNLFSNFGINSINRSIHQQSTERNENIKLKHV